MPSKQSVTLYNENLTLHILPAPGKHKLNTEHKYQLMCEKQGAIIRHYIDNTINMYIQCNVNIMEIMYCKGLENRRHISGRSVTDREE